MASALEEAAAQFRSDLLQSEAETAREITDAYKTAYGVIAEKLQALQQQIETARQQGTLDGSWLYQQERLQRFTVQVEEEIDLFAGEAGEMIARARSRATSKAKRNARNLRHHARKERFTNVAVLRLQDREVQFSGSRPFRESLAELGPAAALGVKDRVEKAVHSGQSLAFLKAKLEEELGQNLNRALTTARTQIVQAYREGLQGRYRKYPQEIKGWIWYGELSAGSCRVCLAMHGTLHPSSEPLLSHPNCRCIPLPYTGLREMERGESWLLRQPESVRVQVLGVEGARLFREGKVKLRHFVKEETSPDGEFVRRAQSLKGARKAAEAEKLPSSRKWRGKADLERAEDLRNWTASHPGEDENTYREKANEHLGGLIAEMHTYTRIQPNNLLAVLTTGRFKSQFETGSSGGTFAPGTRRGAEAALWGISEETPGYDRPLYGYLHASADGYTPGAEVNLADYGALVVKLRSNVRARMTFTGGDSMAMSVNGMRAAIVPSSEAAPDWRSVASRMGDVRQYRDATEFQKKIDEEKGQGIKYVEAQFHGGLTTEDIEEVILPAGAAGLTDELKKLLEAKGIRVRKAE